jgi:hypothetical protein
MARIRTVKPEFWTSEQVVACSPTARLLFIGLWNFCDDSGIHPASAMRIKMEVFPADSITPEQIHALLGELCEAGLLNEYSVEGKSYYQVTGWSHQKIEKPHTRYPSPIGSRTVDDQSPNGRPRNGNGIGREGKGTVRSSDERDDQKCELTEKEIGVVRQRTTEVVSKVGKPPKTAQDRSLVVKACILSLRSPFSEAWLYGAAEGVARSKAQKKKPYAYLHAILSEGAVKVGRTLNTELAKTEIPEALNRPPPNEPPTGRLCDTNKEPPA